MAQLPDNIVSIMMVDNAGAVVSVPVGDLLSQVAATPTASTVSKIPTIENTTTTVVNNNETVVNLEIEAEPNYLPIVNNSSDNLINSIVYQSSNKVGFNTKNPKYIIDARGDSINIDSSKLSDGFRIKGNLIASIDTSNEIIFLGNVDKVKNISLHTLYLSGQVESPVSLYNKFLQVQPDGKVIPYVVPVAGTIMFSNGNILTGDVTKLAWNNSTNALTVVGSAKISAGISTSLIGEYATGNGVNAQNNWTFASNVNIPAIPVNPTHAASKEYVDNTALTGLKLGAAVKTVSTSNITLSGLSIVNGYTPIAGDRILVTGQSTATENGVYIADASTWTRATDSDTDAELRGFQYLITLGTNANFRYGNTNQAVITVGSTNITYQTISANEVDPIFTASPAFGISNTSIANWNTSYNRSPVSLAFSGASTRTLTLTRQDGSTLTSSFIFPVTSVFGRTGDVALTSSDVTTALGFTPYNGAVNPSGYLSSITSSQITTALGYTPYNASNPSGYISGITSSMVTSALGYTPLSSYTETDTLASVTARGASTSTAITSTSTISAVGGFFESSDVRFKNVLGSNPDIDVSKIDTIKYMRTTYDRDKIRYGYSAQDVFDVIPECVNNDGISLSLNYTDIHTLKILQLEKRVAELEAKL